MRRVLTLLAGLALPRRSKPYVLGWLGHAVHPRASIGASLLLVGRMALDEDAVIGSFSVISCRRLLMRKSARIGCLTVIRGPLDVRLGPRAAIGHRNVITRAASPVSIGPAQLRLGELAKITSGHRVDCMASVLLGDFTTLAGAGSQIWTHGYAHAATGPGRARIDGKVSIGRNVYIGSQCCIGAGISIADAITVGAHSSVASDLTEPGLYVSQPLRHIPGIPYERLDERPAVIGPALIERVYRKGRSVKA